MTPIPEQLERELVLPAPPEQVWEIVTSSGWLADEVELDLTPGGDASFSCDEWTKRGWVEEAVAPADGDAGNLVFWWAHDGETATRVELTLEPEGDGLTRLRVVEARPLDVLDVVGIPLPGAGGSGAGGSGAGASSPGPAMLVAA